MFQHSQKNGKNAPSLQSNAPLISTNRLTKSFISYQLRKRKTSIGCLLAKTTVEQRAVGCRRPQFAQYWLKFICGEANRIAFSIISICWRREIFMSAVFRSFPTIFCIHTHSSQTSSVIFSSNIRTRKTPAHFLLWNIPDEYWKNPQPTYLWTLLLLSINHSHQIPLGKK